MPAPKSLGVRRRCLGCAAAFYDLGRTPIHCPKCGELFTVVEYARRPEPVRRYGSPFVKPVAPDSEAPAALDDDETLVADADPDETLEPDDDAETETI